MDNRRIRILHLVGELAQAELTCQDFHKLTEHLPGASLEFQLAYQDGDIELGPPLRLSMQGRQRLLNEAKR